MLKTIENIKKAIWVFNTLQATNSPNVSVSIETRDDEEQIEWEKIPVNTDPSMPL